MFDDVDRLRNNARLRRLLEHYAQPAQLDREAWQDRLMNLDGAEPNLMVKLHGELLAFGWIEQNSGFTTQQLGVVGGCYRVTTLGIRALKKTSRESDGECQPAAA